MEGVSTALETRDGVEGVRESSETTLDKELLFLEYAPTVPQGTLQTEQRNQFLGLAILDITSKRTSNADGSIDLAFVKMAFA